MRLTIEKTPLGISIEIEKGPVLLPVYAVGKLASMIHKLENVRSYHGVLHKDGDKWIATENTGQEIKP